MTTSGPPGLLYGGPAGPACPVGLALKMRATLLRLMAERGIAVERKTMPLLPAIDGDVLIEGLAATVDIDSMRMKFRPWCFSWPSPLPPLLLRHDAGRIAGRIIALRHDARGRLHLQARVTDPEAGRLPALSVAASIQSYELIDENGPDFHAVVTRATVLEVSCTDCPAQREALILSRMRPSPVADGYETMIAHAMRAQQRLTQLKTLMA